MDLNFGKKRQGKRPSFLLYVLCVLPVISLILFYSLRSNKDAMDRTAAQISAPIRGFLGFINSVYPFSLMEVLLTIVGIWAIFYIIKTIILTIRRPAKLKFLFKRLLQIAVIALYAWTLFCWLWSCGYFASGFAEKNGFTGKGVTEENLASTTAMFAEKASELARQVNRDPDGHYIGDRREFFNTSTSIFKNVVAEYPDLGGRLNKPKPMMFSWLMSRTGYTGVYFALTGESNININAPLSFMPATIAHELAHQRGVVAEDEANFIGILAAVTSGYTEYEYAGYLMGYTYLSNALLRVDFQAWEDIGVSLSDEVKIDLQDNYDYWQSQKTVNTGIVFLDNILTSVTETVSETVDAVYDNYLVSQNQDLGLRSYGACVDLLVEYYAK